MTSSDFAAIVFQPGMLIVITAVVSGLIWATRQHVTANPVELSVNSASTVSIVAMTGLALLTTLHTIVSPSLI